MEPANYSAGANLGYFTAGQWEIIVQIRNGSSVIYQGSSGVISVYEDNFAVNVVVNKIIELAAGSVSVSVTAPTVDGEAMTVGWSGTATGSGSATATPQGDGTTLFTFTKSDYSSGYYTFTLNHSSTGGGAAIAVDLRYGERAEITGHIENGAWQELDCLTVKVHSITKNFVGCNYQININSAAAGDKVSFYIEPFAGNVLQGTVNVTWTGGSIGELVPVNGLYTFEMPDADVTINAVYSGVNSDIDISLFKALFSILLNTHPTATSFGYDSGSVGANYFETKGVKLWYDSVKNKICWKNDAGTFRFKAGSLANFFKDCSIFTNINLSGIDTSLVTNMSGMFRGCEGLTEVVLDTEKDANGKFVHFNTANVTDMSYMFCSKTIESGNIKPTAMSLASVDVSGLNTSSVTNMSYMFYMCYQLAELDVSGFNTANVTDMSYMFACYNVSPVSYPGHLTSLDLHGWNFTNVTTVAHLFDRQENLASFSFPGTTNFASLTTMTYMFSHCLSLTPETFTDIVATWTFAGQGPNYKKDIYGIEHDHPETTMFGNYNNTNSGNDGRNYIFRNSMTKNGGGDPRNGKFAKRKEGNVYIEYRTKDDVPLYIGGGGDNKYGKLTTKDNI